MLRRSTFKEYLLRSTQHYIRMNTTINDGMFDVLIELLENHRAEVEQMSEEELIKMYPKAYENYKDEK